MGKLIYADNIKLNDYIDLQYLEKNDVLASLKRNEEYIVKTYNKDNLNTFLELLKSSEVSYFEGYAFRSTNLEFPDKESYFQNKGWANFPRLENEQEFKELLIQHRERISGLDEDKLSEDILANLDYYEQLNSTLAMYFTDYLFDNEIPILEMFVDKDKGILRVVTPKRFPKFPSLTNVLVTGVYPTHVKFSQNSVPYGFVNYNAKKVAIVRSFNRTSYSDSLIDSLTEMGSLRLLKNKTQMQSTNLADVDKAVIKELKFRLENIAEILDFLSDKNIKFQPQPILDKAKKIIGNPINLLSGVLKHNSKMYAVENYKTRVVNAQLGDTTLDYSLKQKYSDFCMFLEKSLNFENA